MARYIDPAKYGGDYAYHQRVQDFWRDTVRVYNPLETDFRFKYDSVWWTVKAHAKSDMERYLAYHYANTIADKIIGDMIAEMGNKALEERAKQQRGILLIDKYMENREIWDKLPRMDDEKLRKKIMSEVIVGTVRRFGEDQYEEPEQQKARSLNPNSVLYQNIMDDIASRTVEDSGNVLPDVQDEEVLDEPKS